MSVAAHKNINQANIASVQLNSEPAVTSISVSARIDYIQRFSKQAVLVIDSDTAVYSQAARQFLINLAQEKSSEDNNVAFVSASTKLNDIQMRCRLIEQLFSNTLFDPEKSLAVSILNLSKKNKEAITIVVEHAHALSLQIKYELCQLVDVANKTQGKINVALFGQEQAGQDVATNKSIFKNKLAIVDARSGQLFSLDHAKFNAENAIFTQKLWLKLAATFVVISTLIGLSWFVLINFDNFSLSKVPETTINNRVKQDILADTNSQVIEKKAQLTAPVIIPEKIEELAKTADIRAALLGEKPVPVNEENPAAQTSDILKALDFNESTYVSTVTTEEAVVTEQEKTILAEVPVLAKSEVVSKSIDEALPLALTPN